MGKTELAVTPSFSVQVSGSLSDGVEVNTGLFGAFVQAISQVSTDVIRRVVISLYQTQAEIKIYGDRSEKTLKVTKFRNIAEVYNRAILEADKISFMAPEMKQEYISTLTQDYSRQIAKLLQQDYGLSDEAIQVIDSQIQNYVASKTRQLTIIDTLSPNVPELTPEYLNEVVFPYIKAITELQHLINLIKGENIQDVSIREIKRNSPISISMDGAAEAIQTVKETVVPWRRKHAETIAQLLEQEKQVEIEAKKAEVLKIRASAAKERQEAEQLSLKNEGIRLEVELQKAKLNLALEMLAYISTNMKQNEKDEYVNKLLPILDILATGRLEVISDG